MVSFARVFFTVIILSAAVVVVDDVAAAAAGADTDAAVADYQNSIHRQLYHGSLFLVPRV